MTPLKTETLELNLNDNVAHMRVSGRIDKDTLSEGLEWFQTAAEEAPADLNLCVEMAKGDFENLSDVSAEFRHVGHVLRQNPNLEKCAVVTDSLFVRNSAKVEGAVIPGLNLKTFATDETVPAESWLKGESINEAVAEEAAADTAVVTAQSPQKAVKAPESAPAPDTDNPWDGFTVKDIDL